jgi:SAM-dependent methyltransferase
MDRPPEDAEARRERLAAWAAEQERRIAPEGPGRPRPRGVLRRGVSNVIVASLRYADRIFDRRLHTASEVRTAEHEHSDRVHYVPTPWHVLPRAFRFLRPSGDDTFVDFGCGKGRIVHQAARWPLRRVIGVEISPELAEQGRAVVAAHRNRYRCADVEIVVGDAADYRVPDDMTIGFLYHPFTGETLDRVLQAVIDSIDRRPRRVRLIYVLLEGERRVLATGRFRHLKDLRSGMPFVRVVIFEST